MAELHERRVRVVRKAIETIETKLGEGDFKFTIADLVRLLQIEKELEPDSAPRELKVTWVDSDEADPTAKQ